MSLGTILIIVLIVLLMGGYVIPFGGGPWLGTGYYGGGAIGLILVVVLILILLGRI